MRARLPDVEGFVEEDGVTIGYEVFGQGDPTILLLPSWTIIHSRFWKMQVPYLSRHHRVVTYDSPGNGRSSHSIDTAAHGVYAHLRYTKMILDEVKASSAVVVGLSQGSQYGVSFAAEHPNRVDGMILIGPSLAVLPSPSARGVSIMEHFEKPYPSIDSSGVPLGVPDQPGDWSRYNRQYWLDELEDFAWFFFGQCFTEPHSTKQIEDSVGWTMETSGEVLAAEWDAPTASVDDYRRWAGRIECPVLLIHGTDDRITPIAVSQELAGLTGAQLITMEGSGHIPLARDPVKVNLAIEDFIEGLGTRAGAVGR